MIKFNIFTKLDEPVLLETISLPQHVFKDIEDQIIASYKKVHEQGIKRLSGKSFPDKDFPMDFSGTKWAFLNELNPHIVLINNNKFNDCFFTKTNPEDRRSGKNIKDGVGYVTISLNSNLTEILLQVTEHELIHYIQYLIVSYKIKKGLLPDIPIEQFEKYIGGIPPKRMLPTDVSMRGYKVDKLKKWLITTPDMHKNDKAFSLRNRLIVIPANSAEEAISKAIMKVPSLGRRTDLLAYETAGTRRVEHIKRPIEYYTNLVTLVRRLQYMYYTYYSDMTKKDFFSQIVNRDKFLYHNSKQRGVLEWMYNYLDHVKKNEPLYRRILSKIYTAFVNVDASADINRIKSIIKTLTVDIMKSKLQEPNGN